MLSPEKDKAVLVNWTFPLDQPFENSYLDYLNKLSAIFSDIKNGLWPKSNFDELLHELLIDLNSNVWGLLRVFHDGHVFKKSTVSTTLNVAILAFAYGKYLNWDASKIELLVRSALLHDVGMLFIPEEITTKAGRVTEKDRIVIETHPSVAFELLKKWGETETIRLVGLQHHESFKGSGYPLKIEGIKINNFAQIIAVCVVFTAMLTDRDYRNSMVGYLAMKSLIQDQGQNFNPAVLKIFVSAIGLHPPGSIVLLSDGSVARVLEINSDNPIRPRIRILLDSAGNPFRDDTGATFDMGIVKKVFIARPVNFQDIINGNTIEQS